MNVFAIGASKNIGYYASLRLLAKGASITFLLRSPSGLQADDAIKPYMQSGKARLVKGDAMNFEDVSKGWEEALAAGDGTVDLAIFTVGGYPSFSIRKGLYQEPVDLVTRCFLNVLRAMPSSLRSSPSAHPKIVVVTTLGLTRDGKKKLPLALKPVYALIAGPHDDKLGVETIAAHYTGRDFNEKVQDAKILTPSWTAEEGVVEKGAYKSVVVLRPSLYTDGECQGDKTGSAGGKAPYRVAEEGLTGYTISRKDVAHFIAGDLLKDWEKWEGKCVGISY